MAKNKNSSAKFKFQPFTPKQLKVLTWWMNSSPYSECDAIIADGAIRSGKSLIMSLSFIVWAMNTFEGEKLGMAGKTIGSFRRNVLFTLKIVLKLRGYTVVENKTENMFTVQKNGRLNYFYLFGGRDERSQDLVQGFTSAGFYFDEVTLMPQSFVNQAVARCSVDGSKLWFNCNPSGPYHWFKLEWIDKAKEKNVYRLHFELDDNPSLSDHIKQRYRKMYTGIFYDRFVKGLWVLSEGIIYDMFSETKNTYSSSSISEYVRTKDTIYRYISIDYGTTNPTVFLDIYDDNDKNEIYVDDMYYYDSKKHMKQKTDAQYADDLEEFISRNKQPMQILLDPSAASFKAELLSRGIITKAADNEVLDGIRNTSTALGLGILKINSNNCKALINELMSYIWDEKASLRGEEKPVKDNDHGPDALRYFIKTIVKAWRLKIESSKAA